jgi:hypothetical protein
VGFRKFVQCCVEYAEDEAFGLLVTHGDNRESIGASAIPAYRCKEDSGCVDSAGNLLLVQGVTLPKQLLKVIAMVAFDSSCKERGDSTAAL